jgi:hypothetical protein
VNCRFIANVSTSYFYPNLNHKTHEDLFQLKSPRQAQSSILGERESLRALRDWACLGEIPILCHEGKTFPGKLRHMGAFY